MFKNILGSFTVEKGKVVSETIQELSEARISMEKGPNLPQDRWPEMLGLVKEKQYFPEFYNRNLEFTKQSIKDSVSEDQLIIQAIANMNELDRVCNVLVKRLREWQGLYLPELGQQVTNQETFAELVQRNREEVMKEFKIDKTMGADLNDEDVQEMHLLAERARGLFELRRQHENYLEKIMKKYCPNLLELAGVTIAAKLIALSKSLKRLAMLPASTVQLLGAEKALFRHIKSGSKSPKYGVIFAHQLIQQAGKDKGKMARVLADKLTLCARLDFFKGEFKATEYRKLLEEKFK
jgi:nucleolar protein 56